MTATKEEEKEEEEEKDNSNEDYSKNFHLEKITSDVYGVENPPQDWADVSLLIPHEGLRREAACMCASIDKLIVIMSNDDNINNENNNNKNNHNWKAVYFCEWVIDWFAVAVHDHHTNEEDIYFPWVATKATLPDTMSHCHEELQTRLNEIIDVCETIIRKKGMNCYEDVTSLQPKIHAFRDFMGDHLQEEEQTIPALLREHFTESEEAAIVQKIGARGGFAGIRIIFNCVNEAMMEWTTDEYHQEFFRSLPAPVRHFHTRYGHPDHIHGTIPKRDAPFLETKPVWKRVRCCMIPFCCIPSCEKPENQYIFLVSGRAGRYVLLFCFEILWDVCRAMFDRRNGCHRNEFN